MSNLIFSVFGENDCPSVRQKTVLASKNVQLGQASQISGLLKGKNVGLGAQASSQKRALVDVGNKIVNKQLPPSAKKVQGKQQIAQNETPMRNITNTPKNKLPRSSAKSCSAAQLPSSRPLLWNQNNAILPFSFTPKQQAEKCMSAQKNTPRAMKIPYLGTPISTKTFKEVDSNLNEEEWDVPERMPSDDESEGSYFDHVLPAEECLTEEELDRFMNFMRTSFRMSEYYVPSPEPQPIDESEFYPVEEDFKVPWPTEDLLVPEIPELEDLDYY